MQITRMIQEANKRTYKRRTVKSNNRKSRNAKTAPGLVLSRQVNLYDKSSGATVNILYPCSIEVNTTTNNFTWTNASDVRALAFGTVISNTFPFVNYSTVYSEYRISSASAIVNPMVTTLSGVTMGMLYMTCDPEAASSANPVNATVVGTQESHLFSFYATAPKSVTFRFPGIGKSQHTWLPTTDSPGGAFYIGVGTPIGTGSNVKVFDVSLSVQVQFRAVKTH